MLVLLDSLDKWFFAPQPWSFEVNSTRNLHQQQPSCQHLQQRPKSSRRYQMSHQQGKPHSGINNLRRWRTIGPYFAFTFLIHTYESRDEILIRGKVCNTPNSGSNKNLINKDPNFWGNKNFLKCLVNGCGFPCMLCLSCCVLCLCW